jgi:hypothetical protein
MVMVTGTVESAALGELDGALSGVDDDEQAASPTASVRAPTIDTSRFIVCPLRKCVSGFGSSFVEGLL